MVLTEHRIASKKADTDHKILDILADRYSPRSFEQVNIADETLYRLFEAMRWAPSSMNEQPWRIIYARKGEEAHQKIAQTLMKGNKPWAEEAPILMLTIIKNTFENGTLNNSALHDLGLAMGNLSVQATYEGVGLHQMGGFSRETAKHLFQISEGYEAVTAVALGYFGDPNALPERLRERELAKRTRKPIAEFAFHEEFKS